MYMRGSDPLPGKQRLKSLKVKKKEGSVFLLPSFTLV
jgi:hypothetical protein